MKQSKKKPLNQVENSVMNEFAKRLNVTPQQIMKNNNRSHNCDLRYLYCKLRHDVHGLSYTATGREIGRVHTTVRYGIMRIDDLLYWENEEIMEMWNRVKDISGSCIQVLSSKGNYKSNTVSCNNTVATG